VQNPGKFKKKFQNEKGNFLPFSRKTCAIWGKISFSILVVGIDNGTFTEISFVSSIFTGTEIFTEFSSSPSSSPSEECSAL
jgi:hypothetical protein